MASIRLTDVSVDIPVFNASNRSIKNNLISAATGGQIRPRNGQKVSIRAIDRLSLDLPHGTRVGLVGHNGAGKSTLMRVMAGIFEPNAGTVEVEGSVVTMFDIGFGLDADATGWDNIALRGRLLGFSRKEIAARAQEIAQTSELGEFLDMPIRSYSTGMITRLAFAISTAVVPDILLIDEGIGAGDAAFLTRARERMAQFIGGAGLLVMASHSDQLLQEWCTTAIWMEHGQLRMHGELNAVLAAYHQHILATAARAGTAPAAG